jgi:hypothetical protein
MTDPVQRPLTDEEQEQAREPIREAFDEVRAWLAEGDDSAEHSNGRGEG